MHCNFLIFCIFLNSINFLYGFNESDFKVTVGLVTYIGSYLESWSSDPIASFRGIRYAEPPVGELRFKVKW